MRDGSGRLGAGAVTEAPLSAVDETVANISRYIMLLQQDMAAKRQRMRDIGAKGGAARRRNVNGCGNAGSSGDDGAADDMPDLFATAENATVANTAEDVAEKAAENIAEKAAKKTAVSGNGTAATGGAFSAAGGGSGHQNNVQPLLQHCCGKRKEAKENNILNNKNNLFSERKISLPVFQRPSAAEVQAFVSAEGLKVDAATFVDFYDSHGWCVGRTAIKNWKATVRLWHRRACSEAAETGLAAGYAASRFRRVSVLLLSSVVLFYQVLGTLGEWAMTGDFGLAVQDFRIGLPGMALQIAGGYWMVKYVIYK